MATPLTREQFKLDLNSLLLAFASAVIDHYDLAATDFVGGEEQADIDRQTNEAAARVMSIRDRILTFHEKWPNYFEDRLQLLNEIKEKTSAPPSPAF